MSERIAYPGRFVLGFLLAACLLVLYPFLSALLWAVILCSSSWPIYKHILKLLKNRHTLAALVMSLLLTTAILVPLFIVGGTLGDGVREGSAAVQRWIDSPPLSAPQWLADVPVVGQRIAVYWQDMASDREKLLQSARGLIEPASSWLLKLAVTLGGGMAEMALSIFIAFFLFRDGQAMAGHLSQAVQRIGGDRGVHLISVASNTVHGVVYGILGTSLVQAVVAAVGFVIVGVPRAGLLALLTFFVAAAPLIGPMAVCLPVALWVFFQVSVGWGIFMLIWSMAVAGVEYVVKPWFIGHGSDMPFILILFGILGGAMAFGFIGIFLGPTLLAVGYRVVVEWIAGYAVPEVPEK
jgi:predicted PurR-regulated permease PerM